jgi:hypothetical protein
MYPDLINMTWAEFIAATPEQRRRWRDRLLREWEQNRERELAEDERADGTRGHWGD